ncbi:MAG: hypothetical protein LBO20_07915, partial [Bifidobacteriaceae bacterium]|nr:hypothetical protein [Bifidobacteriaceae bacterium]
MNKTLLKPTRRLGRVVALAAIAGLAVVGLPGVGVSAAEPQTGSVGIAAWQAESPPDLTHAEHTVLEGLDPDYIVSHIKHIEDNIGPGRGGSPAERRRAEYLASQLQALGYGPWTHATAQDGTADYLQEFADTSVANLITGSVTVGGREYAANGPGYNAAGVYQGFTAPPVTAQTVYFATLAEAEAAPA